MTRIRSARLLLASLACATTLTALPAAALDLGTMTPAEKTAFGAAVRDYLLENPEVLVEALNALEARRAVQAAETDKTLIADNAAAIFKSANDWVGGNPQGDITIVEFMDYRCGYCQRAFPEVASLLQQDGRIRFVVKEYPILGEASELASRFAISVRQVAGDAAYGRVHDALMTQRGQISLDSLKRLAEAEKLDGAAVMARMNSPEVTAVIAENYALANRLGIEGTPAFVIGDEMVRGYKPLDQLQEIVAGQRS